MRPDKAMSVPLSLEQQHQLHKLSPSPKTLSPQPLSPDKSTEDGAGGGAGGGPGGLVQTKMGSFRGAGTKWSSREVYSSRKGGGGGGGTWEQSLPRREGAHWAGLLPLDQPSFSRLNSPLLSLWVLFRPPA